MHVRTITALSLSLFALNVGWGQSTALKPAEYVNPDAAEVVIPPYEGETYEAVVPDTLDLAERAKLSIRGLTNSGDPEDDYAIYWLVNFHNNPPMMKKETHPTMQNKFMESLPLLRIASGSDENDHVDQIWMNQLVKSVSPAGNIVYPKGAGFQCRIMNAMVVYYLRDGDPAWKERIEGVIGYLNDVAVHRDDYAYLGPKDRIPKGTAVDNAGARMLQPLGHYYALTGYAPAKELGDKFVNYALERSEYFGPEGEWLLDQHDPEQYPDRIGDVHFGAHSHALLYLTDYAIGTNNKELLEYCKKSCDWALHRNSTIEGQCETATRIGFFLEYLNPYYPTAEMCSIADIVPTALKLAQAGIADDYWDQLDGWIRNHMAETQIMNSDWISSLASPSWSRKPDHTRIPLGSDESDDRVAERKVGNFFSWPSANDGCPDGPLTPGEFWACPIGIMECCGGNGSRALYCAWENIMTHDDGKLRINFMLNRASKWADLDSYIPYTGRVDLKVKSALEEVTFRVPSWIESNSAEVVCEVNGEKRALDWSGRYVNVGAVEPRDVVRLTFPIEEETIMRRVYGAPVETVIGGYVYDSITFRGNEVVDIQPEGKNYPYYQRDHYRTGEPRLKTVRRFVSNEEIPW